MDKFQWVRKRTVPILALFPFVILFAVVIFESQGITNIVSFQTPISGEVFAQIVSGGGSLILSYALIVLYWSQTRIQDEQTQIQDEQTRIQGEQTEIQSNQEQIMKQSYIPHLSGEIASLHVVSTYFRIRNAGDGPAFNVRAEWEFGGQSRSWEIPALVPGEDFGFPLIEKESGNWYLNTNEIEEYLESGNHSTKLHYHIKCEDMFGEEQEFEDEVDFEVMNKRSEAQEMWDEDPVENISNEMGKIRRETRKISRYAKKRRSEMGTRKRRRQLNSVREAFQYHDKLSFDELQDLTGFSEYDLNRTLERLDSVGELSYNESTNTVKKEPGSGSNQTIDAFDS